MVNMNSEFLDVTPDCEIVSSRIMPYPPEVVFKAWTDPDILKIWWGPAGFTNTFHEYDLRPGGHWRFTMHGPEKGNYQNHCVFLKIEEPNLIAWNRLSNPIFRVVATFDRTTDGNTDMNFRMQFAGKEECDKIRKFAIDKNEENFDRLEMVLQAMSL
jgi:uncharacterized protein YndB with AHSA1/START domain